MYYITALLADMYYKKFKDKFEWGIKGKTCISMIFHLCSHWTKYIPSSTFKAAKAQIYLAFMLWQKT